MAKRHVQPYPFETLVSYSTLEMRLLNAVFSKLDSAYLACLRSAFETTSTKYLGEAHRLVYQGLSPFLPIDASAGKSEQRRQVMATFFIPGLACRVTVGFSLLWAKEVVYRLLGGSGEFVKETLSLSPMEEGVFEFFLLKGVQTLEGILKADPSATDRVSWVWQYEGLLSLQEGVAFLSAAHPGFLHLCAEMSASTVSTPLSLYFDGEALARQAALGSLVPLARDHARYLALCGHVQVPLAAMVGTVSLAWSERQALEEGDILLFDEAEVRIEGDAVKGQATVRMGGLDHWVFRSELAQGRARGYGENGLYGLTLTAFAEER